MATLAAAALSAQIAMAQTSSSQSQSTTQSTSSSQTGIHASKLIGAEVKSSNGEKYGKVEDIILDPQSGRAKFAIIGKGGVLRVGEKRLPVPWEALSVTSEKQVTLNMDPQKLESAPTLQSSTSTELDNPQFVVVIYKYYEVTPPASGAAETQSGSQSGASANSPTKSTDSSQPDSGSSKP